MISGSKGTIYRDGRVKWDGVEDEGQTILAVNHLYLVEHIPSGGYWNNGGFNKTSAWIEVRKVKSITPGHEPDTWRVELSQDGGIDWHPTQKVARGNAIEWLSENVT